MILSNPCAVWHVWAKLLAAFSWEEDLPAAADHLFKKDIKQISISNYIAPSNNMSPGQVRSDSSHVYP